MDSNTQIITAQEVPGSNHSAGRASTRQQPSQIRVEEKLHYRASITDRTETTLEEAVGTIDVQFPVRPPTVSHPSMPMATHPEDIAGYLAITNYHASIWQPPLRDDGNPVKIPIKSPPKEIETGSSVSFDYMVNPEESRISIEPVRLEAKIIDKYAETKGEASLEFLEGLRLELTISSEIDTLSEIEEEKIASLLKAQITHLKNEADQLHQQLNDETKPENITPVRNIFQRLFGRRESANIELSNQGAKSKQKLKETEAILQEYEKLVKEREQNLLRKRDFLSEAIDLLQDYPLPNEQETPAHPHTNVNLAHLALNIPYISQSHQTKIRYTSAKDWLSTNSQQVEPVATNWRYNPERKALELRDHLLYWNSETKLFEMTVHIDLDPPTAQTEQIIGSAVLYLDNPISDMKVGWSASKKGKVQYKLSNYRTWLILDFSINFADVFRMRSYLLERKLHFEGVVFHSDHLIDIKNILKNQGLIVSSVVDMSPSVQPNNESKQLIKHLQAVKQGPDLDVLSLQITSQISEGTHTIIYNQGEEKLSKSMRLGTLDISMQAQMTRQSQAINYLLNTLQMNFERIFTSTVIESVKEDE